MVRIRRIGGAAVLISSLLLLGSAGGAAAAGTYSATFCYDAANDQIDIHQVWSDLTVDTVTAGIGGHHGGLGFQDVLESGPVTSGDRIDTLPAVRNASTVGASVLYLGDTVGSATVNKVRGSWAKSMPAC
jgi:hypothetical protein